MKILLDTNVMLDFLLKREPFANDAKKLIEYIENKKIIGYLCPTTITTLHYLISKQLNKKKADEIIFKILKIFEISILDKVVLIESSLNNDTDFEDSVIYTSAFFSNIDFIVTRDKKGFKKSKIKVVSPTQMLSILFNRGKNV